jgi:hypothetical protein
MCRSRSCQTTLEVAPLRPRIHGSGPCCVRSQNALSSLGACLSHMRRGDWEQAWRICDRELRRRRSAGQLADCRRPRHLQSIWDGSALAGRRVLVRCYHGLGDTVQFIRFAARLKQIATQVIVWAQAPLIPLLRTVRGIDRLIPLSEGRPQVDHDIDIEIMELPYALRVTLETLPTEVPYLHAPSQCVPACRSGEPPRVGIVWQSGSWDPRRSIPQRLMEDLVQFEGVAWQIFQRGPALQSWPRCRGELPSLTDVMAEARAMRSLDLLISADTLSAHLGGALAVRTWTLIPADADWRWMQDRDDTPWYPTMRLFRQKEAGAWEPVISRVLATLKLAMADGILASAAAMPARDHRAGTRCLLPGTRAR